MFFTETRKKFTDKYRDRSGILMLGYDADKKMWIVEQKSGRIEYYDKKVDFLSWTKFDLSESSAHLSTIQPMIPWPDLLRVFLRIKLKITLKA